jgi:hypothetical protein
MNATSSHGKQAVVESFNLSGGHQLALRAITEMAPERKAKMLLITRRWIWHAQPVRRRLSIRTGPAKDPGTLACRLRTGDALCDFNETARARPSPSPNLIFLSLFFYFLFLVDFLP